jgi:type I restriction enzyme S subunit
MTPEGWRVLPLSEVADYRAGRTPARARPDYWPTSGEGVPWVAISDMTDFGIVRDTKECISATALQRVFRGESVPAGTLIMSFKLTIGRVATLGIDACHNEAIISIYPRHGIDRDFLGYFLSQVDYHALQDRQVKGNTLNRAKIDRIAISLPPLEEQLRITAVLDLVRQAIRLGEESLRTSRVLKRSVMNALFTRGLRNSAQKETEIGRVPANWDVVPLGSLGHVGNGSTPKKSVSEYWSGGTFPWLTSAKVHEREVSEADFFVTATAMQECHLPIVEPGAVLIAITGQGKTLGHCAVLRMQATINQHLAYVATDLAKANPSFIRGYLETQYDYLRQVGLGGGSTKGALTCAFLQSIPIPLPRTIREQDEIVAILDAIDQRITLHRRKRAVLNTLFKALLRKLMTGELRIADLDLSGLPASQITETAA